MAEVKQNKEWMVPILVLMVVAGAFFVGRLTAQVEYLTKGGSAKTGTTQPQPAVAGAADTIDLSADGLKAYAKEIGLDSNKFASCLDGGKYAQKVSDDADYGESVGVSGTPTFFVNGVILVGAQPQSEFEKIIDAELKDGSGDKVAKVDRVTVQNGKGYLRGNNGAAIKIVEFSDFECPFCQRAAPTVEAVLQKYGDKISLEYRHYPLTFHPNADRAAQASECAGEQGKFWEMHDKMFGI